MKRYVSLAVLSAALLSPIFVGCTKENFDVFPDRDCLYTGTLTIHRPAMPDWQLSTFQLTDDTTPLSSDQFSPLSWQSDEQSKTVPIGIHRAVYMPQYLSQTLSHEGGVQLLPESSSGFVLASEAPILMGREEGKVEYNKETILDVLPKDVSKAVRVNLSNSSADLVSNITLSIDRGLIGYDCLKDTATMPSVFLLSDKAFDLPSSGYNSRTGYVFDVDLPMTLHLSFKDKSGADYFIEFEDAFRQDEKNERLYVAELDLSEAGLEEAGVKKTVKAIRIDGRDVTFPPEGGVMTMDVHSYRVTTVYSGGEQLSQEEEEIAFSYELAGDDAIDVSFVAPNTFDITAGANLTQSVRTKKIKITADGVSRLFTVTQPYSNGFVVDGEVQ